MKITITPDVQKSEALKKMANITLQRLKQTDMKRFPSNTLIDYYDSIHKLLEAITLKEGVKIKGEGAHQELINYVAQKHQLSEQRRQFMQLLRDYRNRISYEGFMIKEQFITSNLRIIKEIIDLLTEKLKK
jgi:hypothetical protein